MTLWIAYLAVGALMFVAAVVGYLLGFYTGSELAYKDAAQRIDSIFAEGAEHLDKLNPAVHDGPQQQDQQP